MNPAFSEIRNCESETIPFSIPLLLALIPVQIPEKWPKIINHNSFGIGFDTALLPTPSKSFVFGGRRGLGQIREGLSGG